MSKEKYITLSIIVPIYNVEKYLDDCINSILSQTFKDFELILVNDGSTDNCGEICEKFKKLDSRIIVIHQENQGVSAARNTGISISTGEYIGFVDPDDTIKSDMYENLIKYSFNGSIDIVVCKIRTINTVMQTEKVSNIWYKRNIVIEKDDIQQRLIPDILQKDSYSLLSCVNKIYKNYLLKQSCQFDEEMTHGEDARLNLNLITQINKIVFLDKDLYIYYRRPEESLTKKIRENMFQIIKDNKNFGLLLCKKYGVMGVEKDYYNVFIRDSLNYIQDVIISNYSIEKKKKIINEIINDYDFVSNLKQYSPPSNFYSILKLITRTKSSSLTILLVKLKMIVRGKRSEN